MTTQQSLQYLINRALEEGYCENQISPFVLELKERIEQLEDWDVETLNNLYEELF